MARRGVNGRERKGSTTIRLRAEKLLLGHRKEEDFARRKAHGGCMVKCSNHRERGEKSYWRSKRRKDLSREKGGRQSDRGGGNLPPLGRLGRKKSTNPHRGAEISSRPKGGKGFLCRKKDCFKFQERTIQPRKEEGGSLIVLVGERLSPCRDEERFKTPAGRGRGIFLLARKEPF